MPLRRPVALVAALVATGSLAACGDDPQKLNRSDSESSYLNIAGLKYQVQLSRQLNERDVEDKTYLSGMNPADAKIDESKDVWFAVFMRVENAGKKAEPTALASGFTITDTEGNAFSPVRISNSEAYTPTTLQPTGLLPDRDSTAAYAPSQGEVLVYKIPYNSLANRPLELTIKSPMAPQKIGVVDLDV